MISTVNPSLDIITIPFVEDVIPVGGAGAVDLQLHALFGGCSTILLDGVSGGKVPPPQHTVSAINLCYNFDSTNSTFATIRSDWTQQVLH
jgi:hypothetical protein